MSFDYEVWKIIFTAIAVLSSLTGAVYTYRKNKNQESHKEIEVLQKKDIIHSKNINDLEKKYDLLTQKIESLPGHNSLSKVYEKVNGMDGHLNQLVGQVTAMNTTMAMMNQHLLEKEK